MESMQNIKKVSKPSRALRFESLENRLPLATAAFMVNLYHDDSGVPGAEITNDTVAVGDSFFVEITAQEFAPFFDGMSGIALDISWNPQTLREIDANWDPQNIRSPIITSQYPLFRRGTLDNVSGVIDNLSADAFVGLHGGRAIGDGIPEQFSLMRFQALAPAETSPFSMSQGASRIVTVPVSSLHSKHLYFEPQTITILPRDAANETLNLSNSIPSADSPLATTETVVPDAVAVVEPVPATPLHTASGANSIDSLKFCPLWEVSSAIAAANPRLSAENTSQNVSATQTEGEADLAAANNSLNAANDEQTELASPSIPTNARFNVESVPTIDVSWNADISKPNRLTTAKRDVESSKTGMLTAMAFMPTIGYVSTRAEENTASNADYAALVDDLIASDSYATAKSEVPERLLDLLVLASSATLSA
jgi:hypothetical protein